MIKRRTFDGVIEVFDRHVIAGWVAVAEEGHFFPAKAKLIFDSLGIVETVEYRIREGGRTGFTFHIPTAISNLAWHDYLDDFQAVVAYTDNQEQNEVGIEFRIPFFKSAFAQYVDDNPTTIKAARLKEYSNQPRPNGRIAAFTIAYNEHLILPLWARYYAKHFGEENLFVIDQDSRAPLYAELLPKGVNIIRVPRDMFDNWLIERLVATLQRFLLESYDSVLYTDSDEFVCFDPEAAGGVCLRQALLGLNEPIGITKGYDLIHDIASEAAFDIKRPVLSQRLFMHRQPTMDKPVISRVPLNWVPGFHKAKEGGAQIPGFYLLHLRWFDRDFALHKGGVYRESAWNQYDVDARLAEYQREAAEVIESRFESMAAIVKDLFGTEFDRFAEYTSVPDWMRTEIFV